MPIIIYRPELFPLLQQLAKVRGSGCSLLHRPFVDHYYTKRDGCKLYLALSEDGDLLGTLGMEALQFECEDRFLTIHAGSNYYSVRPGGAAAITRRIIKSIDLFATYGGSEETHRILQRLKYCCYFTGIRTYFLNYYHGLDTHAGYLRKARSFAFRQGTGQTLV